ncbi:MAG: PAS domain S-box protein [Negativicutes bacterium]|nr:PAS domain S-box protein [Negativicutes bacterium]
MPNANGNVTPQPLDETCVFPRLEDCSVIPWAFMHQLPEGFALVELDTKMILKSNQVLAELLGYGPQLLCNIPLGEIMAENMENAEAYYKNLFSRQDYVPVELHRYRKKDGSIIEVEHTGLLINHTAENLLALFIRPVPEYRLDGVKLQRCQAIWDNTRDIILWAGLDGAILEANSTACLAYDYTTEELLALNMRDLLAPDTLLDEESQLHLASKDGTLFETFHKRKNGGVFPVEISARGEVIMGQSTILSVVRDITQRKQGQEELKARFAQLQLAWEQTIEVLAMASEARDPYTSGHQKNVAKLAEAIGRRMGLGSDAIMGLRLAAMIHDIGKIRVPGEILSKPGELTRLEVELIRTHVQYGHDILQNLKLPWNISDMVLQHHERIDGSGYPQGLKDKEIGLEAKIIAVADVMESMATHRPYRPARGVQAALHEIEVNRGILYDPEVVDACTAILAEGIFSFDAVTT